MEINALTRMKVAQQLTEGNFTNEKHRLRVNLMHSSVWVNDHITDFLKPFGITQQQFNILRILRGQFPDPISTKQLRERMIMGNSDTSRLIDRLIDKNLVWKRPCPHDGRLIQAFISEDGQALLKKIDEAIPALDGTMDNLTEEEARLLNQLLIKMIR